MAILSTERVAQMRNFHFSYPRHTAIEVDLAEALESHETLRTQRDALLEHVSEAVKLAKSLDQQVDRLRADVNTLNTALRDREESR